MAIPDEYLRELAEKNDIVDVVGSYVPLTKRSGQNLFGLCPFHSEKTPSFSVSPSRQMYHCFGCGKGGSVFNFIMEMENVSFPDAVEFLARRVGMSPPEQDSDPGRIKRERLYKLNRDAAMFFVNALRSPEGETARGYMARRGITAQTATRFGLGAAPDSWDAMTKSLKAQGYGEKELFEAGLIRHGKNGGAYDAFRNRLMFPVVDVRGNVVAFSGRALGDFEPKYMNSPETAVFSKSRNLFGLNLAKKSKMGYIILVEGNVDVVSLHQAGFDCAVASLGTSLTPEQARILSRYTNRVVLCYDADEAGKKASQRAIALLDKLELEVKVLSVTGAKDPDEYISKYGAAAFANLLDTSENHIQYRLDAVKSKYDLKNDEQKVAFLREATELVATLPGSVEREVYSLRVAELCGVSAEAVKQEVARRRRRRGAAAQKEAERELFRPAQAAAKTPVKNLRFQNVRSAEAEQGVIRLLCRDSSLFSGVTLDEKDFSSPELWEIYSALKKQADEEGSVSTAAMVSRLSPDGMNLLSAILQKPEASDPDSCRRALSDYIEIMKSENGGGSEDLRAVAERLKEKKGFKGNG